LVLLEALLTRHTGTAKVPATFWRLYGPWSRIPRLELIVPRRWRVEKTYPGGREDLMRMKMKTILGPVGMMLAGLTLAGCQSNDSGSSSRMLSRQSDAFARPPMNSVASTMPGNKSLGINDTNTRPGTLPSSANAVQQASAMQNTASSSTGMPASGPSGSVSGFDQAGAVVSRPMPDASSPAPQGPKPPSPPGGYSIPTPTTYTPSANTSVPTRKPGDDQ